MTTQLLNRSRFQDGRTPVAQKPSKNKVPDLFTVLNHAWIAQAMYVTTKLGIPDRIAERPESVESLAKICEAQPIPLFQVLRALAEFGLVEFQQDGSVRLTAEGARLRSDVPYSIRSYILLWGDQLYSAGRRMLEQVQTGKTAFECEFGETVWNAYAQDAEAKNRFAEFMDDVTRSQMAAITAFYSFQRFRKVVDVGAGRGALLSTVLARNPHLHGVWCDRPESLDAAQANCEQAGVVGRIEFVPGDFLTRVPPGGDLYVIKHVLHDWEDGKAAQILKNIAAAMPDDATLLIIEAVLGGGTQTAELFLKCRDLEQMIWTGGRTRSQDDFERLLSPHGLTIQRVIRTLVVDCSLIEIVKGRPA